MRRGNGIKVSAPSSRERLRCWAKLLALQLLLLLLQLLLHFLKAATHQHWTARCFKSGAPPFHCVGTEPPTCVPAHAAPRTQIRAECRKRDRWREEEERRKRRRKRRRRRVKVILKLSFTCLEKQNWIVSLSKHKKCFHELFHEASTQ